MKSKHIIILSGTALIIATSIFVSCTKDKTPTPVLPCDPDKIYFQNDILPLVVSNCAKSGCHDAITKVEGLNLTTYSGIMKIVKAGSPNNSELIEVINKSGKDIMPPAPSAPLSADQKALLSKWISEGATNEYCSQDTSNCTNATVSYTADVSKLISSSCLGCHSGSSASGGINLSTYAGVKAVANSGKLYNSVAQNGSAVAMPPAQKLSTCDISKIKSWVDAGSLNN